jgi:hypothetical protein
LKNKQKFSDLTRNEEYGIKGARKRRDACPPPPKADKSGGRDEG